jgi:hypothetical protein
MEVFGQRQVRYCIVKFRGEAAQGRCIHLDGLQYYVLKKSRTEAQLPMGNKQENWRNLDPIHLFTAKISSMWSSVTQVVRQVYDGCHHNFEFTRRVGHRRQFPWERIITTSALIFS